ncbi:MAG: hypothetical protein L0Y72_31125 [Gemmataceae bacterium]|nr:hypothetical protein [Gemmataceae bacterium]MCI0743503.1 hypothetical protein [Gemmataceae bacterium]
MKPFRLVRHHPWLSIPVLTLLGIGLTIYFFVLREGPINTVNFERIQAGMSPADLAEFLGPAHTTVVHEDDRALLYNILLHGPLDFKSVQITAQRPGQPNVIVAYRWLFKPEGKGGKTQRWDDADRAIEVVFDANERAVVARFESNVQRPTLWTRIKNWFQNLW